MKIGDEVYVHGYVDEIRNGVVIIRNEGGYFGTAEDEIICFKAEFHKEHIEPEVIIEPTDEPTWEQVKEYCNKRCLDIVDSAMRKQWYKDEPKTQTKTQNSNLTFKTLEYCDICDHKGCEECVANALDEHCMPSQFKKQIEDECAKEYEELGLKELKELIEADRKTESNSENRTTANI